MLLKYNDFAAERLRGNFGEMGSWRLILPYLENRKTLDIGCADGLYLKYMNKDSVGIEQVPELVSRAKLNGLKVIMGDIIEGIKDLDDNEFDAVLFSHVLEHVDCPIHALREIARVLKSSGILILGLPIENNIYRDMLRMDYFDGTHIYAFTIRNAIKLLKETGFEPIKVIYHLPKCRSNLGLNILKIWNVIPFPFREYFSMAYWIIAEKRF